MPSNIIRLAARAHSTVRHGAAAGVRLGGTFSIYSVGMTKGYTATFVGFRDLGMARKGQADTGIYTVSIGTEIRNRCHHQVTEADLGQDGLGSLDTFFSFLVLEWVCYWRPIGI